MNIQDREQIKELITRRRRQLAVHAFIYYQLNDNVISDYLYDAMSNELVQLQQTYPDIASEAPYATEFKDFDGSTGYDLPYGYPEFQKVAFHLLAHNKKHKKNQ